MICWQYCLQKMVALSSTEAEYMAMSDACQQISQTGFFIEQNAVTLHSYGMQTRGAGGT